MSEQITPIVMPKWGLSMKEGTLSAWHVEEGQTIVPGQEIMDVETDKIANAVEAADGGLLRRRVAAVGQVYPVKALLGVMAPASVAEDAIDAYVASFVVPAVADDEAEQGPVYLFVETPSGRLRYASRPGDGEPIVMIHGFGGDLDTWLFNIDAIGGPVHALDLPGHGGSTKTITNPGLAGMADAAEQFMEALGITGAHLVGHSMGGAVAGALALRGKGLVKSLTLISPAGLGEAINTGYIDGFVALETRRDAKPLLQQLFADPNLVSRQMIDEVLRYKRLDGVREALRALAAAMFRDGEQLSVIAGDLAKSPVPTTVIWGAEDSIIPAAQASALPDARIEVLPSVGHMAQMEAASRVNELIRARAGH